MESITNWCVYMHENRINGKKYIGITGQKPTRRWQNGKHYSGNAYFYAAIQKYGWDGFRHEILYTELTQEEAERLEVELIAKYSTQDPEKGYNLASGGAVNIPTAETRRKTSEALKGHILSAETRARISTARKGKNAGASHHMARAVVCLETGVIYRTSAEAAKSTGVHDANIRECCKGRRQQAGGFRWGYVDEAVADRG